MTEDGQEIFSSGLKPHEVNKLLRELEDFKLKEVRQLVNIFRYFVSFSSRVVQFFFNFSLPWYFTVFKVEDNIYS